MGGEICKEYDLICSNTFFKPKKGIKEKLATWYSHNGEIKRQIDYFNITKKHRSWIHQITNNQIANTRQNMQHRMIIVQLQIKLKRKLNYMNNDNTPYDIKKLRSDPKKCKEDIGHFLENNDININNWNTMTSKIITILKNNYTKTDNKTKQTSEYTK